MLLSLMLTALSCQAPVIPKGYALIYGVADYGGGGGSPDLNYTDDDAEALAELLQSKGWDVRLRVDGNSGAEATLDRLVNDAEDLKGVMSKNDRLLFYFSGHGIYLNLNGDEPNAAADAPDEVLLLYDSISTINSFKAKTATASDVINKTISDDSLASILGEIPAATRTVIIDACFAGGFIGDSFTVDTVASNYTKNRLSTTFYPAEAVKLYLGYKPSTNDLPASSFSVLAASGESEESYESSSIEHGYFTYYLLKSPKLADYNLDGYISLTEAYKYTAVSIENNFNKGSSLTDYQPHVSAFPVDPVLFKAD